MNLLLCQTKSIYFFFLFSFLCGTIQSQCIIEQLLINGNNGPNLGQSLGHQFVACETGLIEEIEMHLTTGSQASTMKVEIYESATGWANLIWTVDNVEVTGGEGPILIDMISGSGTSQELTEGVTYSARFWNTGSGYFFFSNHFGSTDVYPDGFGLNHWGNVVNWFPNYLDRYFRIAINGAALPVELIDFTATAKEEDVALNWSTSSEENNAGFEIQQSIDGLSWSNIGFVEGRGTTSEIQEYSHKDYSPSLGDNYYRLKQIDYDGKYEFSPIRHILMAIGDESNLQIYPNPSSGFFTMTLHNPNRAKASLKLFSSTGQIIWERRFTESEAEIFWEKEFDLPQRELYFLVSQIGDKIETNKVTIVDER